MNKKSLLFASAALATLSIAQQDNQVQADSVATNTNADTAVTKDTSSEASSTVKLDQTKETEKTEANQAKDTEKTEANQAKDTEKAETTTSEVKPANLTELSDDDRNREIYKSDKQDLQGHIDYFNENSEKWQADLNQTENQRRHDSAKSIIESNISLHTAIIDNLNKKADTAERNGWWGAEEFRSLITEHEALRAQGQALLDGTTPEAPKTEEPKVETPKVEKPKTEEPKVETPKVEEPKTEAPKTENKIIEP